MYFKNIFYVCRICGYIHTCMYTQVHAHYTEWVTEYLCFVNIFLNNVLPFTPVPIINFNICSYHLGYFLNNCLTRNTTNKCLICQIFSLSSLFTIMKWDSEVIQTDLSLFLYLYMYFFSWVNYNKVSKCLSIFI